LFATSLTLQSQQNVSQENYYNWFDNQVGIENTDLYNGIRYKELYRVKNGKHKFFQSSNFIKGKIVYKNQTYYNIELKIKRGKNEIEDKKLAKDLLSDPKEIAEHLMLLDLGRNDVGRVSVKNSVKVTEKMIIENYSHVMHIVSNVEGKIDNNLDALDALMAGFPAGILTSEGLFCLREPTSNGWPI